MPNLMKSNYWPGFRPHSGTLHTFDLKLTSTAGSSYQVNVNGKKLTSLKLDEGRESIVPIQLSEKGASIELLKN